MKEKKCEEAGSEGGEKHKTSFLKKEKNNIYKQQVLYLEGGGTQSDTRAATEIQIVLNINPQDDDLFLVIVVKPFLCLQYCTYIHA